MFEKKKINKSTVFFGCVRVTNKINDKIKSYLGLGDHRKIGVQIVADPLRGARQSDSSDEQKYQDHVRKQRGEPNHLKRKRFSRTVVGDILRECPTFPDVEIPFHRLK